MTARSILQPKHGKISVELTLVFVEWLVVSCCRACAPHPENIKKRGSHNFVLFSSLFSSGYCSKHMFFVYPLLLIRWHVVSWSRACAPHPENMKKTGCKFCSPRLSVYSFFVFREVAVAISKIPQSFLSFLSPSVIVYHLALLLLLPLLVQKKTTQMLALLPKFGST